MTIMAGGEPPTLAKVREMERAGARFFPNYASSGAGVLGNGCAKPLDASDIHLFKDVHALISFEQHVEGFETNVPAFHLTSLSPRSAKICLNAQMDDYGIVEERACGCELEQYGYTTHVRQVRSFRKLTGEGVTLIGSELLNILENVLPARFGGTPLDYQLVERENQQGLTRVHLVIHPRVEITNPHEVIQVVLNAMRNTSPTSEAARTVWAQTNTLQIERAEPVWSARGKLNPLRVEKNSSQGDVLR
jgi:hypothetical protein